MTEMTDRKTRRIERVRGEIMDAAILIIAEKGFKNATTKEIAAKADMAEGTLYNYFQNKDDILMQIAERYLSYNRNFNASTDVSSVQEFIAKVYTANVSVSADERVKDREILQALLPEFLTDKNLSKLYFERIVQPFLAMMEAKLTILQEKGLVSDYDVRTLSRMLYSSLIGYAILENSRDPVVSGASPEFRKEAGRAYVEVLGKGMAK